jgi:predicted regulator of amino acid metabolism with ACT domain
MTEFDFILKKLKEGAFLTNREGWILIGEIEDLKFDRKMVMQIIDQLREEEQQKHMVLTLKDMQLSQLIEIAEEAGYSLQINLDLAQ